MLAAVVVEELPAYQAAWSDGCSYAPDISEAVRLCCVLHDQAFYYGGTWAEYLEANVSLGACVSTATDVAPLGALFALATTVCGWLWWRRREPPCPPEERRDRENPQSLKGPSSPW